MLRSRSEGFQSMALVAFMLVIVGQSDGAAEDLASRKVREELASQGKLRLAFPVNSSLYVTRNASTGELRGVSLDIGNELSSRLSVPLAPMPFQTIGELIKGAGKDQWDIATVVFEQDRTKILDFTRPYMDADATYLVRSNSAIRSVSDADKPGIRISVAENSAFDLFLTRSLKNATLVRRANVVAALETLLSGESDALAAPRQVLMSLQSKVLNSRVLEDWFDVTRVAVAVPKGRQSGGLAYVEKFLAEAMMSGWMQQAIDRAGLKGVKVPSQN
jgi:polar amino acid transport system substrate-binding protein